jgi:hypothetical protein
VIQKVSHWLRDAPRRVVTRVVRVEQKRVTDEPERITLQDAQRITAEFTRTELVSSLRQLVYLRDFSCKDSVKLGATQALIKLALSPDGGSLADTDVQRLGISTDELSEFLRKVSNSTPQR